MTQRNGGGGKDYRKWLRNTLFPVNPSYDVVYDCIPEIAVLIGLHHIQLAMPQGGEAQARQFFGEVLGLTEINKPEVLAGRGGIWFEHGPIRLHLGVEDPFTPARKAHPAFQVASLANAMMTLSAANVAYRTDIDLPGIRRVYVDDPFGNRIELLEIWPIPPPTLR